MRTRLEEGSPASQTKRLLRPWPPLTPSDPHDSLFGLEESPDNCLSGSPEKIGSADDLWGTGNGANLGPSSQTITMPDLGGGARFWVLGFGFSPLCQLPKLQKPALHITSCGFANPERRHSGCAFDSATAVTERGFGGGSV
jgi:hypothetical protein